MLNKEQMSKRQGISFISCFAEVLDSGVYHKSLGKQGWKELQVGF